MTILTENITTSSTIVNGDCLEALKNIPDNSIDLIITDPPYNLGRFMKGRGTKLILKECKATAMTDLLNLVIKPV